MRIAAMGIGLAATVGVPGTLVGQRSVSLAAIITPFLVDSGVRTRGLPWTTGHDAAIVWQTAGPVATHEAYLTNQGVTQQRIGHGWLALGSGDTIPVTVSVHGTAAGIQRIMMTVEYLPTDLRPMEPLEASLLADGVRLTPLKCDRATEGASYGNLVFILAAPGKQGVGFWENWNCGHDACGLDLTLLYRRRDVTTVECAGS